MSADSVPPQPFHASLDPLVRLAEAAARRVDPLDVAAHLGAHVVQGLEREVDRVVRGVTAERT